MHGTEWVFARLGLRTEEQRLAYIRMSQWGSEGEPRLPAVRVGVSDSSRPLPTFD